MDKSRIYTIDPDFGRVVLWDEEGVAYDCIDNTIEVEIGNDNWIEINIPGLSQWHYEFEQATDFASGEVEPDFDWKSWHKRGIELAKQLREKLPQSCELWYDAPYEDKSGTIKEKFLIL